MSAVSVTSNRTISRAVSSLSTAVIIGVFLAVVAAVFAFRLDAADGLRQSVVTIWTLAVAQFLPVLMALLAMDSWSEERRTRRIDLLLSVAVREREYVVGKVLGVWLTGMFAVVLSLVLLAVVSSLVAPSLLTGVQFSAIASSLFILLVQGAFWSAASVAVSSLFERAFVSALISIFLLVLLPRALWYALLFWAPQGAETFGDMPFDAQAVDFAAGYFSTGAVGSFLVLFVLAVFIATRSVERFRLSGVGSHARRFVSAISVLLAIAVAISTVTLLVRLDVTMEMPVKSEVAFSPRMRHLLAESTGEMEVTAFLPRRDPSFRSVAHFLRALKHEADASLGLKLTIRFVDPRWDFGSAERLARRGAKEGSLVFEKGRRTVALSIAEGLGDRVVASAIQRLAMPPQRRDIYWTKGHGEAAFDAYGSWGMSDIARELIRNGYRNQSLDLAVDRPIPAECALVVIAGAKDGFARIERARLDAYLRRGGRLLVLMDSSGEGGIVEMLPSWGLRFLREPIVGAPTLSGTDVIVSDFSDHPLCAPLKGSRIVLERPLSFENIALAEGAAGADRLEVSPLVNVGTTALAMVIERGGNAGRDLALRPTRIVVVGDASFVMNGQLSARANANRDFFMNAVSYLSGTDAMGASGLDMGSLKSDFDRATRRRFAIFSIAVAPALVVLLLSFVSLFRRSRK